VFTAPQMGRLAEIRDGWRQVVQTGFRMEIVILTRKDSRIRQLEDLRNRSISVGS
jgi:phosphonate transport system substrate-binding protein